MSTVRIDEVKLVAVIKKELRERVSSGSLPDSVGSFSELHDYMDANELGGMTQGDVLAQLEEDHGSADAPNQGWVAVVNRVQGEIDAWIKVGGLRGPPYEPCQWSEYPVSMFAEGGLFHGASPCSNHADGRFAMSERPMGQQDPIRRRELLDGHIIGIPAIHLVIVAYCADHAQEARDGGLFVMLRDEPRKVAS